MKKKFAKTINYSQDPWRESEKDWNIWNMELWQSTIWIKTEAQKNIEKIKKKLLFLCHKKSKQNAKVVKWNDWKKKKKKEKPSDKRFGDLEK